MINIHEQLLRNSFKGSIDRKRTRFCDRWTSRRTDGQMPRAKINISPHKGVDIMIPVISRSMGHNLCRQKEGLHIIDRVQQCNAVLNF